MNDRGQATEGVTPGAGHPCAHGHQGSAVLHGRSQAGATERLFWEEIAMSPSPASAAGVLSAARAAQAASRGSGDSRADAPASARPPEEDEPARLTGVGRRQPRFSGELPL